MNFLEQLNKERIEAMKAKDKIKSTLLATLIGEAKNDSRKVENRDPTDAELTAKIQKFLKSTEESLKLAGNMAAENLEKLNAEKEVLLGYLPEMKSPGEVRAAAENIVAGLSEKSPKQMGQVMAALKEKFPGQIDMKSASATVKDLLSGK